MPEIEITPDSEVNESLFTPKKVEKQFATLNSIDELFSSPLLIALIESHIGNAYDYIEVKTISERQLFGNKINFLYDKFRELLSLENKYFSKVITARSRFFYSCVTGSLLEIK